MKLTFNRREALALGAGALGAAVLGAAAEQKFEETAMAVKPRIKLDKKEAKKGDLVEVKALVSHVMETGQRKDAAGNTVPRKILNKFVCTVAGKQVFAADFETAVSANPLNHV